MNTNTIDLMLRDLRPADADCVDEWFSPAQRAVLLREIMSAARPPARDDRNRARSKRRRPRMLTTRRLLVPVAGVVAAAVAAVVLVFSSTGRTPPAQAAVSFRNAADGEIVATITNPFAAQKQLDAAFAAHGLHISVNLVAVSPGLVGTVVYSSDNGGKDAIQSFGNGPCVTGGGGCPIGLKIPTNFTGQGSITLGRPAKAGEHYESTASAFAPGEVLHCSGLFGAKVSAATSVLRTHGLTVAQWRVGRQVVSTAPAENYIWQIDPMTASTVRIWTEPTPPATTSQSAAYNAGCSGER